MKRKFNKKDFDERNTYLERDIFGFLTDKDDFFVPEDEFAEIPSISFIYQDTNDGNKMGVFFGTPTQCRYEMNVVFCLLNKLHTITAEIEVGIDGKKMIVAVDGKAILILSQMHPVRLNLDRSVTLLQEDDV